MRIKHTLLLSQIRHYLNFHQFYFVIFSELLSTPFCICHKGLRILINPNHHSTVSFLSCPNPGNMASHHAIKPEWETFSSKDYLYQKSPEKPCHAEHWSSLQCVKAVSCRKSSLCCGNEIRLSTQPRFPPAQTQINILETHKPVS